MNLINDKMVKIDIDTDEDGLTIRLTYNWRTKLLIAAMAMISIMLTVTAIFVWMEGCGLVGPRGPLTVCATTDGDGPEDCVPIMKI